MKIPLIFSQTIGLVPLLIVPSLYLALASTNDETQCTSAEDWTCEQECPSEELSCNLNCLQTEARFYACQQTCALSDGRCANMNCQGTQRCTQNCNEGKCGRLSCDDIFRECDQHCKGGGCSQAVCRNSPSCKQSCSGGNCGQLTCNNASDCHQNCWSGAECEELKCGASVDKCRQDSHYGNLTCLGRTCDQACKDGACSMSCNGEDCDQNSFNNNDVTMTCNATVCHQWCYNTSKCNMSCATTALIGAQDCLQECRGGGTCFFHCPVGIPFNCSRNCDGASTCYNCTDEGCYLFSGAVRVMAPGFTGLASILLAWKFYFH